MTTESTSMEHSNILHTCTGGPDWTFWQPERKSSTKHTLDLREKKTHEKKRTNERNAEKYLQILNIQYIQTRGLLGCHHGDDDGGQVDEGGGGRREPSCPKHRTCSGVSWRGDNLGI